MKKVLLTFLALMVMTGSAAADDQQTEFNVQLKNVKKTGSFTLVVSSRSYRLDGSAGDPIVGANIFFPYGVGVNRRFLKPPYLCDVAKLKLSTNPDDCKDAMVGTGDVTIDARPIYPDTIPVKIFLFLAAPAANGAVASLAMLGKPHSGDSFVDAIQPVLVANLFNQPSPDKVFGYRMEFPVSIDTGTDITITAPQLTTTVTGLSKTVQRGKKTKHLFWLTPPTCPLSKKLTFRADYTYKSQATASRTTELNCIKVPK